MHRTVWLASYPKSGNTWLRVFLSSLLHPDRPLDVNDLPLWTHIASARLTFDDLLGLPSSLLTEAESRRLRPDADRALGRRWDDPLLVRKAHDAYSWLPDGRPLLGRGPYFAAIYLLRDPWDVVVSAASFFSLTLDQMVEQLADPHSQLAARGGALSTQFPQRILSWEGHALSWLDAPLPLHVMRYEEMVREPLATFRAAVRFLGLEYDDEAIAAALEACRLERLQAMERRQRFREAPPEVPRFFRRGAVGEGLERLAPDQLARLSGMKQRVERALAERFA